MNFTVIFSEGCLVAKRTWEKSLNNLLPTNFCYNEQCKRTFTPSKYSKLVYALVGCRVNCDRPLIFDLWPGNEKTSKFCWERDNNPDLLALSVWCEAMKRRLVVWLYIKSLWEKRPKCFEVGETNVVSIFIVKKLYINDRKIVGNTLKFSKKTK